MRLNVGCGLDVRDGWVNLDPAVPFVAPPDDGPLSILGDARDLERWHGEADVVLLSHVLHLFDPVDADRVLWECRQALAPDGLLVVVEPDVLHLQHRDGFHQFLRQVVGDDVEPTLDGKWARWATWHGTRRTVWSPVSLEERLARNGLTDVEQPYGLRAEEWLGDSDLRRFESFVVTGRRPAE